MDKTPKRRGRPPKPTSLCHRISSTMNINVNTPPRYRSPTAESNSNIMMRRGTPNWFDPIMKVSPTSLPGSTTPRRRSRKNSSASSTPVYKRQRVNSASQVPNVAVDDYSAFTPQSGIPDNSLLSFQVNSKAIDNIAMITQSESLQTYRTPPASVVRPGFSSTTSAPSISRGSGLNSAMDLQIGFEGSPRSRSAEFLGAPVQLGKETGTRTFRPDNDESKEFSLKLVVDSSGRAVLSSGSANVTQQPQSLNSARTNEASMKVKEEPVRKPQLQYSYSAMGIEKASGSQSFNLDVPFTEDLSNGVFSQNAPEQEQRISLRRFNSDITGLSSGLNGSTSKLSSIAEPFADVSPLEKLPQTPRRENYFLAPTMGQTPNNTGFNLTPQFSSMMNSMMFSPQQSRKPVQGDFFGGSELFQLGNMPAQQYPTVNMIDLMNLQSNEMGKNNGEREDEVSPSSSPSVDSGDARLALKKIIQVKRES
ncbi:hypothetical protein PGUG_02537 [Meyerozyma guilliermondii ATCC 6260]|uniref:Uncharacterized protein n=1 Tax=Meyerozyma guilliermondii (strain ATCC 6260 / CBS 566 / DSM 6381 / JCM 1539 / NBRC 10279 / NRRL Y-324) TaxID=294746 RepID=A5DGY6_PICGU|nr:uncharacterized protein PGUG_02537 [Meyerozyma guilliermondii ATCC 6260]EDK38439.2 hypothetical protein PGUG_02537 [Meyerozyma guilliermondii ATCC 6260]